MWISKNDCFFAQVSNNRKINTKFWCIFTVILVPKAGSSNWKRIFAKLNNEDYVEVEDLLDIRNVHHIHLPTLSEFSKDEQIEIINSYSK